MENLRKNVPEYARLFFQRAQFLAQYMRSQVYPLLVQAQKQSDRQRCLEGMFLRALAWMQSLAKLDQPTDFQAIAACNRALLEIAVDMVLLYHDKTNGSTEQLEWWEQSAKLHVAENLVKFYEDAGKPVPSEYQPQVEFIQQQKTKIDQQRSTLWPHKGNKPKHPPRWTGDRDLLSDIREADKLHGMEVQQVLKVTLEEFYATEYRRMSWYIHGSTLAGIRNVPPEGFDLACLFAYRMCAGLAMLCTRIVLEEFGFTEQLSDLQSKWECIELSLGGVYLKKTQGGWPEEVIRVLEQANRQMLTQGVLASIPTSQPTDEDDFEPEAISGQPLSEIIIEERR